MKQTLKYKVFFHLVSTAGLGFQNVAQVIGDRDEATTKRENDHIGASIVDVRSKGGKG
jgi:hypothetical protein